MLEDCLYIVKLKISAGALEENGQFIGKKERTSGTLAWSRKNA